MSDIHNALGNLFGNMGHSNPLNARRSEHIDLSAQQLLKVFRKLDEPESEGTLELHHQINITCLICRSP